MEQGQSRAKTEPITITIEDKKRCVKNEKSEMNTFAPAAGSTFQHAHNTRAQNKLSSRTGHGGYRASTSAQKTSSAVSIGSTAVKTRAGNADMAWMFSAMKKALPKARKRISKKKKVSKPKGTKRQRNAEMLKHEYRETHAEQDVILLRTIKELNLHTCTERDRARFLLPTLFTMWQDALGNNKLLHKAYAGSIWQLWARALDIIRHNKPFCPAPESARLAEERERLLTRAGKKAQDELVAMEEDCKEDTEAVKAREEKFKVEREALRSELMHTGNWKILSSVSRRRITPSERNERNGERHKSVKLRLKADSLADEIENLSLSALAESKAKSKKGGKAKRNEENSSLFKLGEILNEVIVIDDDDGNDGAKHDSDDDVILVEDDKLWSSPAVRKGLKLEGGDETLQMKV